MSSYQHAYQDSQMPPAQDQQHRAWAAEGQQKGSHCHNEVMQGMSKQIAAGGNISLDQHAHEGCSLSTVSDTTETQMSKRGALALASTSAHAGQGTEHCDALTDSRLQPASKADHPADLDLLRPPSETIAASRTGKAGRQLLDSLTRPPRFDELEAVVEDIQAPTPSNVSSAAEMETQWEKNGLVGDDRIETQGVLATFQRPRTAAGVSPTDAKGLLADGLGGAEDRRPRHSTPKADAQSTPQPLPSSSTSLGSSHSRQAATPSASAHGQQQRGVLSQTRASPSQSRARPLAQSKSGGLLNAHPISKMPASAKKTPRKKSDWGSSEDSDSGEGDSGRSDGRSSSKRTKTPELGSSVTKKRKMQNDKGDSDQENTRLSQSPSTEEGRVNAAALIAVQAQSAIPHSPIRTEENNMDLDNSPCTLAGRPAMTASSAAPSSFDPSSLAPGLVAGSSSHLGTQDMSVQVGTAPSHELFSNSTSTAEADVSEANVAEQAMGPGVEREPYIAAISQIPDADEAHQGQDSQIDELEESGPTVVEQSKKASRKPAAPRAKRAKAQACEEEVDELECSVPAVEPPLKKATRKPAAPRAKKVKKQKEQAEPERETAEVDELEGDAQPPAKELKKASKKRAQSHVEHPEAADQTKQIEDHLAAPGRSPGMAYAHDSSVAEEAQKGAAMSHADATAGVGLGPSAPIQRSTSVRVAVDYNGGTLELSDGQPASSSQICVPAGSSDPASYPAIGPIRPSSQIDNGGEAAAKGISDTRGSLKDANSLANEQVPEMAEGGRNDGAAQVTVAAAASSIPSRPGNRHSRTTTSNSNRTEGEAEADSTSTTSHGRSVESLAGRSLRRLSERNTVAQLQQEQPRASSPGCSDTQTQVVQQLPTSSPKASAAASADQQDIPEAKYTDPVSPATSATERSTFCVPDSQHPGRILAREEEDEENNDDEDDVRGEGYTEEQSHNVSTQDEEGNDSTTSLLEPGTIQAHAHELTETANMDLTPSPSPSPLRASRGTSPPRDTTAGTDLTSSAQKLHSLDDSPLPELSSVTLRRNSIARHASPSPKNQEEQHHPSASMDQNEAAHAVYDPPDRSMAATEQDTSTSSTARQTRQRVRFDKAAGSLEADTSNALGILQGKRKGQTRQEEMRGSADQGCGSDEGSASAHKVRAGKRTRLSPPAGSEDENEIVVPQVVARLPEPVATTVSSRRQDKGKGRAEAASVGRKGSTGPSTTASTSTARRVSTSSNNSSRAGQSASRAKDTSVASTSKAGNVSVCSIGRETRVFGLEKGYYYPGTLCLATEDASKPFQLVFDDSTSVDLHINEIDRTVRFCRLFEGDIVVSSRDLDRVKSGKLDRACLVQYEVTQINVRSTGNKQGRRKAWGEELKATDQLRVRIVDELEDSDVSSIVEKLDLEDAVLVRQIELDDRRTLSEADLAELESLLDADPEANQSEAARGATVSVGSSRSAPAPTPRSTSAARRLAKPDTSKKAARSEGGLFEHIGLIFTSGDAAAMDDAARARKEALSNAKEQAEADGATIIDGFDALIVTADDHGESQTDTRLTFKCDPYSDLEAIYLIAPLPVTTPKYLLALGVGVPCISHDWVTESLKDGYLRNWRTHALGAGVSTALGRHCYGLQGLIMKHDKFDAGSIASRQAELRLLRGKRVIFVHGKDSKSMDRARVAQRLMTVLGAVKVEVIAQAAVSKKLGADRFSQFDMLVSDCGTTKMPKGLAFRSWDLIKESMIAGRLLPSS